MRGAATIAIVLTRLQRETRITALCVAACGALGYIQRYDDAAAHLAGCLVFGTLSAIAVALMQRGNGRLREIELCEQSAPLYGRELARATALVPCIIVTTAVAAYWIVTESFGHRGAAPIALSLLAVNDATLAALCATVRTGSGKLAPLATACALAAAAFALRQTPTALAMGVFLIAGFIALRQYGEALARYDPVPV